MKNAVPNKIRLLKDIQPNPDWLKSQRRNLLLEISESGKQAKSAFRMPVFVLSNFALKPVMVSLVLFCLILGGGFFTVQAVKDSLPGDFLHHVKTVAEDARVKISSQEAKPKLKAELVKARIEELNRIIKEIKDSTKKKEKVVKAVDKLQAQVVITEFHAVEVAEAVSEKAVQVEEALIEAKEEIAKEENSEEVIKVIDEALAAILAAQKERETWIQMEVKEIKELPVEEIQSD